MMHRSNSQAVQIGIKIMAVGILAAGIVGFWPNFALAAETGQVTLNVTEATPAPQPVLTLWQDTNGNKVQDAGEPTLSGVKAYVYWDYDQNKVSEKEMDLIAEVAKSDASGTINLKQVYFGKADFFVYVYPDKSFPEQNAKDLTAVLTTNNIPMLVSVNSDLKITTPVATAGYKMKPTSKPATKKIAKTTPTKSTTSTKSTSEVSGSAGTNSASTPVEINSAVNSNVNTNLNEIVAQENENSSTSEEEATEEVLNENANVNGAQELEVNINENTNEAISVVTAQNTNAVTEKVVDSQEKDDLNWFWGGLILVALGLGGWYYKGKITKM